MDMWTEAAAAFLDAPWFRYASIRVCNQGSNVDEWETQTGQKRSSWLCCQDCAEKLTAQSHEYDHLMTPLGQDEPEGELGRGIDHTRSFYQSEGDQCHICGCLLEEEEREEIQMSQGEKPPIFQGIPEGNISVVPYAFGLLMHSPTHQIEAQVNREGYEIYIDLYMVSPDDFLLQVAGADDNNYWIRGNLEQMTIWLEKLDAPTTDEMLWAWHPVLGRLAL